MDIQIFWIEIALFLFTISLIFLFFLTSLFQKKRIEKKLDQIFLEVRDLNLRITIVETRLEERFSPGLPRLPQKTNVTKAPGKRGRPRKIVEK
jgi:hypothetical protein